MNRGEGSWGVTECEVADACAVACVCVACVPVACVSIYLWTCIAVCLCACGGW